MDVAFDFDGTLSRHDSVLGYYRALCTSSLEYRFRAAPLRAVSLARRLRLVSDTTVKRVGFRCFLRGRTATELDLVGRRYIQSIPVHTHVVAQLDRHQANGDRVFVVSASWDVYVRSFRENARTLATPIEFVDGRAVRMGVHVHGSAKVRALHDAGVHHLDEVWSDSDVDRPMASMARRAWKVGPDGVVVPWRLR